MPRQSLRMTRRQPCDTPRPKQKEEIKKAAAQKLGRCCFYMGSFILGAGP